MTREYKFALCVTDDELNLFAAILWPEIQSINNSVWFQDFQDCWAQLHPEKFFYLVTTDGTIITDRFAPIILRLFSSETVVFSIA